MKFAQPDLADILIESSEADLSTAAFGLVKLADDGRILFYNQYESELAGISSEKALGKNFFSEIAPCTNNFMVATRYETAIEDGTSLDETLDYVFTYKLKPTKVRLRLLRKHGCQWLCVEKT